MINHCSVIIFFICVLSVSLTGFEYSRADDPSDPLAEFFFGNYTTEDLFVKFYPVGPIFNGNPNDHYGIPTKYSFSKYTNEIIQRRVTSIPILHIVGLDGFSDDEIHEGYFKVACCGDSTYYQNYMLLSHDASAHREDEAIDGIFGYGLYNFEIYRTTNEGLTYESVGSNSN